MRQPWYKHIPLPKVYLLKVRNHKGTSYFGTIDSGQGLAGVRAGRQTTGPGIRVFNDDVSATRYSWDST